MSEGEVVGGYGGLPQSEAVRRIDFERAEVLTLESFPPQLVLTVTGTKPYTNMEVELVPLVYVRQPEYRGIEVVGRLRGGVGLPALAPYTVSISLAGVTGTEGVEVLGATRSELVDVPPTSTVGSCRDWSAWHDHQPSRPATLRVTGHCEFPSAGWSVELRRREPQGINLRDLLLEKVVREPSGPVAQVITPLEARYEEETEVEYDTVTILPDGVSVPVEETH
jgi:hypothetical protein